MSKYGHIAPIYSVAIDDVIDLGDLEQMKDVAKQAEERLSETGNVSAALELLKVEIKKAEGSGGSA